MPGHLPNPVLLQIFKHLDSDCLREISPVCKQWAALLASEQSGELWKSVAVTISPRYVKGRDRRPRAQVDVQRLSRWFENRRPFLKECRFIIFFPGALEIVAHLELNNIESLIIKGKSSEWPLVQRNWQWLTELTNLRSLQLLDCVNNMSDLKLPINLEELIVNSVSWLPDEKKKKKRAPRKHGDSVDDWDSYCSDESEPASAGWYEFPQAFYGCTKLRKLVLGNCFTRSFCDECEELEFMQELINLESLKELTFVNSHVWISSGLDHFIQEKELVVKEEHTG